MASRADRAKIFMPFDPLKGFREALREKERELAMVDRADVPDERGADLDRALRSVRVGDMVAIVYFDAGEYRRVQGCVSACSVERGVLAVVDAEVRFEDIFDLERL